MLAEKGKKCFSIYNGTETGDVVTGAATAAAAATTTTTTTVAKELVPSTGGGGALAVGSSARRTVMFWVVATSVNNDPDTPARWAERLANVKAHRANVTGISPCMYSFDARGAWGTQPTQYPTLIKYVPEYAALGLDVIPLIAVRTPCSREAFAPAATQPKPLFGSSRGGDFRAIWSDLVRCGVVWCGADWCNLVSARLMLTAIVADDVTAPQADGGVGGLASLIKNPKPFVDAAVADAVKLNYSGYNFDNELRGGECSSVQQCAAVCSSVQQC